MTAEPIHRHEGERVPRNAEGIAAALSGGQRMEFYRELLAAAPEQAKGVLLRWWGQAMLDTDPDADTRADAVLAGTVPTLSLGDLLARRRAAGLPVE
ncbi:hypothetical protein K7B10_00880 [Streptomyces flavotricini]|uniref:Uncharacterized protein n=1 Tax=Streptomyces flavotricini TaxID=66888 RepID=A0ABS8DXJ1_9ACTN|nr:hypothetical protein [Streptomyces flavotricini]MCC0093375.1 hypothetical protein [Streptomyces flavotricini]